MQRSSSPLLIPNLRTTLAGRVISPEDAGYDEARTIFLGGFDRRPAAIVRPTDAADVARIITVARESGLPLAVRSGGHSGAGHSTTEGGIVLDLRDIRAIEMDADEKTAWAGAGLTAREYSTTVGEHGLATGFGDTGAVGIGGLTLGGGMGYLTRKYGLTIDSLLAAEVVTADGQILQVDAASHPDLFWAIRGGGGNFGVVTRFQFRLHPVDEVVGGVLVLPATADVIAGVIEATEAAPEELTAILNVMTAPPLPFIPAALHGQLVAMVLLCHVGGADAGARAVAPFRALAAPVADMVRPMRYPQIFAPDDPSFHPTVVGRTQFIERVDRAAADIILDYLRRSDARIRLAQVRALGGAMARVPADATAFAHRDSRVLISAASFYNGPDDKPARAAWAEALLGALNQASSGTYVNGLGDEGEARVRAAFPGATWDRLAAIKARYDPANAFKLNQNIPPRA